MLRTLVLPYYPRVFISEEMISRSMDNHSGTTDRNMARQALCIFDVFVDVCKLGRSDLRHPEVIARFWGFLLCETNANYNFAWRILTFVRSSADQIDLNVDEFKIRCGKKYEQQCRELYLGGYSDAKKLSYYEGWWAQGRDGKEYFVNLIGYYDRYGEGYVIHVFGKLKTYLQKYTSETLKDKIRKSDAVVRMVTDAFLNLDELRLLQDPLELNLFMETAFEQQRAHRLENGYDMESFYRDWAALINFVKSFYVINGLLPEPAYKIAMESYSQPAIPGINNKRAVTGFVKLITHIPRTISNQEAAKKLYEQINGDLNGVLQACEEARSEVISAHRRRMHAAGHLQDSDIYRGATLAEKDYIRRSITWGVNPYPDIDDKAFERTFGCLKTELSCSLGLLNSTTLLPFIYLLINEVPAITRSWLLNYKIKNKHGHDTEDYEESNRASSRKPRRGPASARQSVHLTQNAKELISEIKELTAEARAYLKRSGQTAAKYLLLTSASGTSLPSKTTKLVGMSVQQNKDSLMAQKIRAKFGKAADEVLKNLTLKTIRTTSAVIVYFKTSSVQVMSEALGHKNYNPKLLDRYLPKAIRKFYLSRWITTFQDGIIFECFKESEYLMDVMNIDTLSELEEFIKHHRLAPLPPQLNLKNWLPANERNDGGHLVKGIIPVCPILCTLLITFATVLREWMAKGNEIAGKYLNWALAGEYLLHAVALYDRAELESVSDEVASTFKQAKYSITLASKLQAMIEAHALEASYG
ncbi:hypothetical protein [Pseudomonas putida]|uniref:hypothetical protein n=1 Tax=Pseudomonas putida TaxID=303 RepID=UPI003570B942